MDRWYGNGARPGHCTKVLSTHRRARETCDEAPAARDRRAPTHDELVVSAPEGPGNLPLVWLAAADRPSVTGNEARQVLRGELDFKMSVAPPQLWDSLEILADEFLTPGGHDASRGDGLSLTTIAAGETACGTTLKR